MFSEFIKKNNFFPKYCPDIRNWIHKFNGVSSKGAKLEFTQDDVKSIKSGLKKMNKDLLNSVSPTISKSHKIPKQ